MDADTCTHESWRETSDTWRRYCVDCGQELPSDRTKASVTALAVQHPRAVVYTTSDGRTWEVFVPGNAAVAVVSGGILVQHEGAEVRTILSVRPLPQGETDAAETDGEHQDG